MAVIIIKCTELHRAESVSQRSNDEEAHYARETTVIVVVVKLSSSGNLPRTPPDLPLFRLALTRSASTGESIKVPDMRARNCIWSFPRVYRRRSVCIAHVQQERAPLHLLETMLYAVLSTRSLYVSDADAVYR